MREETTAVQRSETGVLSSFVSYFSLSESAATKGPTPEEQEAGRQAQSCVLDCHLESLLMDTKFLRHDSLSELVKVKRLLCLLFNFSWLICTLFTFSLFFLSLSLSLSVYLSYTHFLNSNAFSRTHSFPPFLSVFLFLLPSTPSSPLSFKSKCDSLKKKKCAAIVRF